MKTTCVLGVVVLIALIPYILSFTAAQVTDYDDSCFSSCLSNCKKRTGSYTFCSETCGEECSSDMNNLIT